jgi:1-deoxy-D-xylulose-5-phosphate reductoisomerase
MKRVVVLGSTGSIGRNVLDVVHRHPEAFDVVGLAAHRNLDLLRAQCDEYPRARVVVTDESCRAGVEAEPSLRERVYRILRRRRSPSSLATATPTWS